MLLLLSLFIVEILAAPCNITGNWTSTLSSGESVVHIEIWQALDNTIQVHATPWGGAVGTGFVNDHTVSLLMVGASQPTIGNITASQYKDYNQGTPAPDCTWLTYGWCKFPYCPIPEPVWPPWPPAPSCALQGPCPPPNWVPTYQLNLSTVIQPCNESGYFTAGGDWGLASFDWSNAKAIWLKDPRNTSTCEQTMEIQAQQVKAVNPLTKVFVYHNLELALEWLESERAAMYDPSKKDYFLQYQTGPNKGQIYNEPVNEGDQYFWNFSNPATVDYWINEVVLGKYAMGSPYVDGIFTDDVSGLGQEHPDAGTNMGLTQDQILTIQQDSQSAWTQMLNTIIQHRGYNWQAFSDDDGVHGAPSKSNCASAMRDLCQKFNNPMLLQLDLDNLNQNIASFLIARGDYWWLGSGWVGCSTTAPTRPSLLDLDVGTPTNACTETATGVFQRTYTKGTAELDCNTWTAVLKF